MDGDASDLELLLTTARQELAELKNDPRLARVPDGRGRALRSHVLDLFGAVEHRMAKPPSSTARDEAKRAFARRLRQGIVMLRGAHAALPWLEATSQPTLNLGSLYMVEEFARILVGPKVDLVVVSSPRYMYATSSWPFAEVIRKTPGFTAKTKSRPVVLNYPLGDSNRLLLHPLFAHELGHASAQEHGLVDLVETTIEAASEFAAKFTTAAKAFAAGSPGFSESLASGLLSEWLRDWIEELTCDHLAIEVAGPAYLWAFAMFVMPLSYGRPTPEHPPNTLRVRLMLEQLALQGWEPYMERVSPKVTAWLDEVARESGKGLPVEYSFLHDQVSSHAELFRDTSAGRAKTGALDRPAAEVGADKAAALLGEMILPLGLDEPLDARAILLGGWQHALAEGDSPSGMVAALADDRLQDLLGKAIEMSAVVTEWRSKQ